MKRYKFLSWLTIIFDALSLSFIIPALIVSYLFAVGTIAFFVLSGVTINAAIKQKEIEMEITKNAPHAN
jgi:hypothetical protein